MEHLDSEELSRLLAIKETMERHIEIRKKSQKEYYKRNSEKIKARSAEYQRTHYLHKRGPRIPKLKIIDE